MGCRIEDYGNGVQVITCTRGGRAQRKAADRPITDTTRWTPCGQVVTSKQYDAHVTGCRRCIAIAQAERRG
jgi:hypothetical protein